MKIYLFEFIEQLTDRWHPEGGLVVIARDKKSALGMLATDPNIHITGDEWDSVIEYDIDSKEERIFIFPDAGCC
jgi:hypothetical protein